MLKKSAFIFQKKEKKVLYLQTFKRCVAQLDRASDYGSEGWGSTPPTAHSERKRPLNSGLFYTILG